MALEITGTLWKIQAEQTGVSKNGSWVKRDFILETDEQFPKKVCIAAWGDKVEDLKKIKPGDKLKVAFNVESREYNDRWYTDIKAWKIDRLQVTITDNEEQLPSDTGMPSMEHMPPDELPF